MLTRASLTIRLHPERRRRDRPHAARRRHAARSTRTSPSSGLVPPGHKVATRAIRAGRAGQALQPDHRLRVAATSRAGEHVHLNNLAMGAFDRDYAFGADVKPTQLRRSAGDVHGHRPAPTGASRRATTSASCRRSTARRPSSRGIADAFPRRARSQRFPNVDGVVALTHGSGCGMDTHGDGMKLLRRTLGGYARHANFAGVLVVGLGCEANQISSLFGAREPAGRPAAAHVQHPGHRRHREDDRARHRHRSSEMLPHANDVHAAAGAGVAHHGRPAVRRLRRLFRASPPIRRSARRSTCWCATAARRSCPRRRRSTAPSTC